MKLEHFQQVIEISKTNSFSQAARNLYMSQPTLSHSIKQLETELGFSLFDRTPDGIVLTKFGRDFVHHATIIMKEYDILQDYCQKPDSLHRFSLRIASMDINRASLAFSQLVEQYSSIPVDFSFMQFISLENVIDRLTCNLADLGLIRTISPYLKSTATKLQNYQLEYHKLSSASICAIVGKANPLYGRNDPVALEELCKYPVIQYGDDTDNPSYSLAQALGITSLASGVIRGNSGDMLNTTIENTGGFGLISYTPNVFETLYEKRNLWILKISDISISVEYGWVKLRKLPLSELANEYLKLIQPLF